MKKVAILIRISAILIFLGRGYQYLFFDAPFRAFLWDESLLRNFVEGILNTPWEEYASAVTDRKISVAVKINGVLFVIAAIASALINKKNIRYVKYPVYLGSFFLFILALLSLKDRFYQTAQFFEFTMQVGVPVLLVSIVRNGYTPKSQFIVKLFIAVTFCAHGLYAIGFYPVPGHFIDMTINSLGVSESTAKTILYVAGILDLLIAIFIFVPKAARYVLLYAFFWGMATALARIVADFNAHFITHSFHQLSYKVVYRLPHGLIPLAAFLYYYQKNKQLNYKH